MSENKLKPWEQPNEFGELPGSICCQRATGKFCYEHDPANYEHEPQENNWLETIEQLLNGPPTSDEIFAAASVCKRIIRMIELGDQPTLEAIKAPLREATEILRGWAYGTHAAESKRRSK
jgi:hypothetical protein